MVQKTIEIGHELGMRVVAEGVETDQQLDFIRAFGCDVAQGYLFSRPSPSRTSSLARNLPHLPRPIKHLRTNCSGAILRALIA